VNLPPILTAIEAELEQLAMNAGRSPGWIFRNHLKN
jgi:hypothetical protein